MIFDESYDELINKFQEIDEVGVDCRIDAQCKQLYREAKDARSDARQVERKFYLNEGEDTSYNYWVIVAKHALTLSLDYTRDVEIMSWLLEALCRLDGYEGCTFGLKIVTMFIEKFSTHCYPQLDEDDPEDWQWISLAGLNGGESQGSLIAPLNSMLICQEPVIHLWEYERLASDSQATDEENGIQSLSELIEHIRNQGSDDLLQILHHCSDCLAALESMDQVLWHKLADLAPPTHRIKQSLEKAQLALQGLAKQAFGDDILLEMTAAPEELVSDESHDSQSKLEISSSQMNRTKAIQTINDVALFFQSTEPHSPIPYMLRRVIAWSKLSWPELMQTMVTNADAVDHIVQQTGMPVQEDIA